MKNFNELSGPWTGLSVQDGIRISERILLTIHMGRITGTGTDKDGEFEVVGFYTERKQEVMLTRRYTWTTEPSQEDVGTPYDYEGVWDGSMVFGRWHPRAVPGYGGPFEMWPDRDEDREELAIRLEEQQPLALPGSANLGLPTSDFGLRIRIGGFGLRIDKDSGLSTRQPLTEVGPL